MMSSSLNLSNIDDRDMVSATLVSQLIDGFRLGVNRFPEAIIVSEEQAKKYFFANNEVMTNFKGIPIEIEKNTDQVPMVVATIDSILKGMHSSRVKDIADVYSQLESMKERILHVEKNTVR